MTWRLNPRPFCCDVTSDVIIPSFVVVNLTNDGYFLPDTPVEAELQLVGFLEGIINGSVQVSSSDTDRLLVCLLIGCYFCSLFVC